MKLYIISHTLMAMLRRAYVDDYFVCVSVEEEYFYKCPDRLRLPLIFYLAHTATLYVNKLLMAGLIKVIWRWRAEEGRKRERKGEWKAVKTEISFVKECSNIITVCYHFTFVVVVVVVVVYFRRGWADILRPCLRQVLTRCHGMILWGHIYVYRKLWLLSAPRC